MHACRHACISIGKWKLQPPVKMVTLGTRDYVEEFTYYTIFDADRLIGGFSSNR